jgi:hypothetical protein
MNMFENGQTVREGVRVAVRALTRRRECPIVDNTRHADRDVVVTCKTGRGH